MVARSITKSLQLPEKSGNPLKNRENGNKEFERRRSGVYSQLPVERI